MFLYQYQMGKHCLRISTRSGLNQECCKCSNVLGTLWERELMVAGLKNKKVRMVQLFNYCSRPGIFCHFSHIVVLSYSKNK